jgi:hypothetical protein
MKLGHAAWSEVGNAVQQIAAADRHPATRVAVS